MWPFSTIRKLKEERDFYAATLENAQNYADVRAQHVVDLRRKLTEAETWYSKVNGELMMKRSEHEATVKALAASEAANDHLKTALQASYVRDGRGRIRKYGDR